MLSVTGAGKEQLIPLLEKCATLSDAEIRSNLEQGYFTVMIPPPWGGRMQQSAQETQDQIKEWAEQYPKVVCYCFDRYSTLLYVL